MGRPLAVRVLSANNTLVRQTSYAYAPDHNSVTQTVGTGTAALSTTTFTDTFGKPVWIVEGLLSNSNAKTKQFHYDNAGNLINSKDEDGFVTTNTYDTLNRLSSQTLPGGAVTKYYYDAAGNVTGRQMPGNLEYWQTFDNASRKQSEYLTGTTGTSSGTTRNFTYSYYSSGNWVGLPATTTDPMGVKFTTTYDDFLRPHVLTASGTSNLPAQNQQTTFGYDKMGRLTSAEQHYTQSGGGFTSGTSTQVNRFYDAYGHIVTEQVFIDGTATLMNQFSQTWDAAGNRASLTSNLTGTGVGAGCYEFNWRHKNG